MQRTLNGEARAFCCYGCCIAFQVKHGASEEWEAAWLLIRLGVGGFLSMNIMMFSLLLYAGAFSGVDAWLSPGSICVLWLLATPAVIILGGPYLRETLARGAAGAADLLGARRARRRRRLRLFRFRHASKAATHVYFDTATMVLMLFTLGRYLEAAGRAARGARPRAAARRRRARCATVVEAGVETRRPVREIDGRRPGAGPAGRAHPGRRRGRRGRIRTPTRR